MWKAKRKGDVGEKQLEEKKKGDVRKDKKVSMV